MHAGIYALLFAAPFLAFFLPFLLFFFLLLVTFSQRLRNTACRSLRAAAWNPLTGEGSTVIRITQMPLSPSYTVTV